MRYAVRDDHHHEEHDMRYMEPGLGYHYPAGTPAPQTSYGTATCEQCGNVCSAKLIRDLGTADLVPECCPKCGSIEQRWKDGGGEFGREDYGPDPDELRELLEMQREWEGR